MGVLTLCRTRLLAASMALLLGGACDAAVAPVDLPPPPPTTVRTAPAGTTFVYYDIVGGTDRELKAQLDMLAPISPTDGRRHAALTSASYKWTWPGYGSATCSLSASKVNVEVEVTMPRWVPPPGTLATLVEKWRRFVEATELHEMGHVEIAVSNSTMVMQAIADETCTTADAAATAALSRIQERHDEYDRQTDSGVKQGAFFR